MNPFLNMEQHKAEFTQNDMKIYQAIMEQPEKVISLSTSDFAKEADVSQPALTRFIKMLGYLKYNDFRSDITAWSAQLNSNSQSDSLPYFERLKLLISEAEKVLDDKYMEELAQYVLSFQRIFTSGIGKSSEGAHLLHTLLRKYGIFVHLVSTDELRDTADNINEDDLLILFSVSANPELMDKVVNTQAKVLLVSTSAADPYKQIIDRLVLLPYLPPHPETCSVSPVLFQILVELLDSYIAKRLAKGER